jgi:hypothetical protein
MGALLDQKEFRLENPLGRKGRSRYRDGSQHAAGARPVRCHEESWLVALFGRVDAGNKKAGKAGSREEAKQVKDVDLHRTTSCREHGMTCCRAI